jgi:hypothetical protein
MSKGFTKLVDIGGPDAGRLHMVLERWLTEHRIPFRRTRFRGEGFVRYSVERENLCCAQAVIPALWASDSNR